MEQNTNSHVVGRRVVMAAMRHEDGRVIVSVRHFDALVHEFLDILERGGENVKAWGHAEQGFIDNNTTFMSREEAWVVAKAANQIIRRVGGDGRQLFSENLY